MSNDKLENNEVANNNVLNNNLSNNNVSKNRLTSQILREALDNKNYNYFVSLIPYAVLIGTEIIQLGDELIFKLPERESNIGNVMIPALHGGCIGGFMENSAALQIMLALETECVPKIIDFSIDYLRTGKKRDTFAKCNVIREGRKLINVAVTSWQTIQREPIATARAHFLIRD